MHYSKLISTSSNLLEKKNIENCFQFNTMKFHLRNRLVDMKKSLGEWGAAANLEILPAIFDFKSSKRARKN